MQHHLKPALRKYNTSKRGTYSHALFTLFAARIAALHVHMDGQQPKTLSQLWKDNRNSLSCFTFWTAVAFGGASFALALAALAVSIVQAWASIRALDGLG
jgi:hypothetical protein